MQRDHIKHALCKSYHMIYRGVIWGVYSWYIFLTILTPLTPFDPLDPFEPQIIVFIPTITKYGNGGQGVKWGQKGQEIQTPRINSVCMHAKTVYQTNA